MEDAKKEVLKGIEGLMSQDYSLEEIRAALEEILSTAEIFLDGIVSDIDAQS